MLDQFTRQNRWWSDPAAINADHHLVRLQQATFRWSPQLPIRLDQDVIYTLRGPRQVGKSTVLKRQVHELLAADWPPRRIFYLDVELAGLERPRDLVAALREYLDDEGPQPGNPSGRCVILLDEVTRIENWAGALRGLVDNGELRSTTIVATGSHTRDLRKGGERLPGRRGGGGERDLELLPLSFREYVTLVDPSVPLPPTLTALTADAVRSIPWLHGAERGRLDALFQRYLSTGGFLIAINDVAAHGAIRADTFELYREAVIGEFTRAGMRESYLREVVNWLSRHLGQEFDYRDIAASTDIGSKDTARNYVDHLVATYVATVYYRAQSLVDPAPAFRGPKKLHAIDPLWWHLVRGWAASDPDPWPASLASLQNPIDVGHLVESVLAVHLRRAFGDRTFYWRPDGGNEIDFVIAPPTTTVALIEAKYQRSIGEHDTRALTRAGGGVIVTRDQEGDLGGGTVYAIPTADFVAAIDAPALGPARW